MSKSFTTSDVESHNKEGDAYIIIEDGVYDISKFAALHPGGKGVILGVAGQNATEQFWQFHNKQILKKYQRLCIGTLNNGKTTSTSSTTQQSDYIDVGKALAKASNAKNPDNFFGELVPYGDPASCQGWYSPYFKASHHRLRAAMRQWVEKELMPNVTQWDEAKEVPREVARKAAQAGWLPCLVGMPFPVRYVGDNIIGGVPAKEFDYFHEMIIQDELGRTGSGGVPAALLLGLSVGLPPILHFGSKYLQERYCKITLTGEKVICLAITEPSAGSDVAQIKTTAVKTEDGKHYIVNGNKKWITNGIFADYFTVAVRTGGPGMTGISLLVIDRSEGVTTRRIPTMGLWASGSTYVSFENVKVPVENLIGKENEGFRYIMNNFNHERWGIITGVVRNSRVCLEEAYRYSTKRKTFGKRLIDHPVIRLKLAHMARQVEASQSQLELVTYQMCKMDRRTAAMLLGGPTALLKAQATTTFEYCAREAAQIFGGLAYTRGGQGDKVERLYREVKGASIPGGSEEIMLDLGVRQAVGIYEAAKAARGN